jgi:hypothetical protein
VMMARGMYCNPFSSLRKNFFAACLLRRDCTRIIEHFAILIDGAPQVLQLAIDCQVNLIEMPAVARSARSRAQPLGVGSAKLLRPITNGFVSNDDPALGHELFDIPVTQGESKIKPSAMTDDRGRESATVIQGIRWAHSVS